MTTTTAGVELVVRPGHALAAAPARVEGKPIENWRSEARAALGLPDRPVIASGHQSECWHAGILAKNLWAQAVATREGAEAVHLVVDQDGFDGMVVEWPFRRADGWWGVRGHRFAVAGGETAGMRCPAFRPRAIEPGEGTTDAVANALRAIETALLQQRTHTDAAMQGAAALLQCAAPWLPTPRLVRASDLMRTSLAQRLVERMLADPAACAQAFNAALASAPRAARALRMHEGSVELPVWLIGSQGERVRANAAQVSQALQAGTPVVPRAFLMSALARTALADRFVHGLGGGVYESATDRWFRGWLGWVPPAFDVVSANARLSLPAPSDAHDGVTPMPFRRAWCDPHLLAGGGTGPSPARRRALEMIAALPRGDARRRTLFRDMLSERNEARMHRAGDLESLQALEASAAAARQSRELAARRTWCFALLPPIAMEALRDEAERRARA